MKYKSVDVVSHISNDIKYSGLKTIAWIPDFQHKYLQTLFSKRDIVNRDIAFAKQAQNNDIVILSSYAAKDDFVKYYPEYANKAEVLQFVPSLDFIEKGNPAILQDKYGIIGKFFYVPNQYWVHKNHKVILEALSILREEGKTVLVVSTGNTKDCRNPEYMNQIKQYITDYNIGNMYHILGTIPYEDVQMFSRQCLAYINPSLFEGWSTTVEEAKYQGKPILLSNLKVHIEQKPSKGIFFDPMQPEELAVKMWELWNSEIEENVVSELIKTNEVKKKEFAKRYYEIIKRIENPVEI